MGREQRNLDDFHPHFLDELSDEPEAQKVVAGGEARLGEREPPDEEQSSRLAKPCAPAEREKCSSRFIVR